MTRTRDRANDSHKNSEGQASVSLKTLRWQATVVACNDCANLAVYCVISGAVKQLEMFALDQTAVLISELLDKHRTILASGFPSSRCTQWDPKPLAGRYARQVRLGFAKRPGLDP
jgi:hypothetical protein